MSRCQILSRLFLVAPTVTRRSRSSKSLSPNAPNAQLNTAPAIARRTTGTTTIIEHNVHPSLIPRNLSLPPQLRDNTTPDFMRRRNFWVSRTTIIYTSYLRNKSSVNWSIVSVCAWRTNINSWEKDMEFIIWRAHCQFSEISWIWQRREMGSCRSGGMRRRELYARRCRSRMSGIIFIVRLRSSRLLRTTIIVPSLWHWGFWERKFMERELCELRSWSLGSRVQGDRLILSGSGARYLNMS